MLLLCRGGQRKDRGTNIRPTDASRANINCRARASSPLGCLKVKGRRSGIQGRFMTATVRDYRVRISVFVLFPPGVTCPATCVPRHWKTSGPTFTHALASSQFHALLDSFLKVLFNCQLVSCRYRAYRPLRAEPTSHKVPRLPWLIDNCFCPASPKTRVPLGRALSGSTQRSGGLWSVSYLYCGYSSVRVRVRVIWQWPKELLCSPILA